jgi:hypothetical protein
MTWGSDDMDGRKPFDWKLHLALLPVYGVVMAILVAIIGISYCGLIQFGTWGPIVGLAAVWFVGGLFYAVARKT